MDQIVKEREKKWFERSVDQIVEEWDKKKHGVGTKCRSHRKEKK